MKKLLLFVSLTMLLTSCIEIKETLKVNSDGSGNFQLAVNMAKLGKSLGQQGQQFNMTFVTEIQNTPDKADSLLRDCKGISNLKTSSDKGIYSVGFDFKNSKALNEALYKLFRQKRSAFKPDFVKVSKHRIKQMNFAPIIKKYLLKAETNIYGDMLYQFIKVENTFLIPSKSKSVSNIKALQEDEDKTVKLNYTLYELMNNDFDYGITIRF